MMKYHTIRIYQKENKMKVTKQGVVIIDKAGIEVTRFEVTGEGAGLGWLERYVLRELRLALKACPFKVEGLTDK